MISESLLEEVHLRPAVYVFRLHEDAEKAQQSKGQASCVLQRFSSLRENSNAT